MLFKQLLLLLIGILSCFLSLGQKSINTTEFSKQATIWQGMSHRWDEGNHRYSRCGSLVESSPDQEDSIRHSGASGSLRDRLYFNTKYTTIKTPDIAFHSNVKDIEFKKEHIQRTEVIPFVSSIQLSLPDKINGIPLDRISTEQISVILNGFDMISLKKGLPIKKQYDIEKAFFQDTTMTALSSSSLKKYKDTLKVNTNKINTKIIEENTTNKRDSGSRQKIDNRKGETSKLFKLDIYIDSLKFDPQNKQLLFKIFIDFGTNCKSAECKKNTSRNIIRYLFRIGYLVMVHNPQTSMTIRDSVQYAHSWNCKKEIFYKDSTITKNISLDANHKFQTVIPMFKRISICTNHFKKYKPKAFHLQELSFLLNSTQQYHSKNPFNKNYLLSANLFYKTWRRGNSLLSYRSKGRGVLESEVLLLAIKKEAIVDYTIHNFEGVLDFETCHFKQTPPNNASASMIISAQ